jgi:TrmH family RNA methyltransferase
VFAEYNESSMPEAISSHSPIRLRPVSSRQNALVKQLRQGFSQGQAVDGLCAVEGARLIEEAIRSRLKVHALFVRESARSKAERILDQVSKRADLVLLPDTVFDGAVLTEHPQGIAALIKVQEYDFQSALRMSPALVIVAAAIQDPGNFGTLVRSAEAFGATAVLSTEGTVNHWNPKTVRASAGSIFRMPAVKTKTEELLQQLRSREIRLLALVTPHDSEAGGYSDGSTSRSPRRLQEADLTRSCALLVGNEGAGVPRELLRRVDEFIAIPQTRVESLNAGVAASVALYEAQRQRSATA